MNITISKKELQRELQKVGVVVKDRSILPILDNFLFEYSSGILSITGNDQETQIQAKVEAKGTESVKFCIEKSLLDILKTLPEQPITLSVNAEMTNIQIKHSSGNITLAIEDAKAYPETGLDFDTSFAVPADLFLDALEKSAKQMANDEFRSNLSGVFVDIKSEGITFVATDRHRMSKVFINTPGIEADSFIIPRVGVLVLIRTLSASGSVENIKISTNSKNLEFEIGNTILSTRRVEGEYPNYNGIIPTTNDKDIIIDAGTFSGIITRLLAAAPTAINKVQIEANSQGITFSAKDIDFGRDAVEKIDATCNDEIIIGFNGAHMLDLLSSFVGPLKISMADRTRAIVIQPIEKEENIEQLGLIMPLIIN